MTNVKLEKVVKAYGGMQVVHGVDLEVNAGEFVVLVGPSGCGKSTILRMIAGLEEISGGRVSIGDRVVNRIAPKDRDVAMVFQNYALYPHLSVEQNIAFGLRLRGMAKDKRHELVMDAAGILGLTDYLDRRPADLSGGQRQRVAMGRAIVRDPSVFLFDEPLSNLDAKLRNKMRAEIKRLHSRLGTTSIYVTHDQVEAMTLADRIAILKDGRVEQVGTPLEIFGNPANAFVAGFMGSPPMNLVLGTISGTAAAPVVKLADGSALPVPAMALDTFEDGSRVQLGLRPETIQLADPNDTVAPLAQIRVDLVEPLGMESLVHAELGDTSIVVKVPGVVQLVQGSQVGITVAPEHCHLFAAKSGARLHTAVAA
ncbi:ABC transporter ATP-binding protein [Pseudoruegeria sp. SHC-113]|uniref:ABC transporter ATP-binding protein n=1 Tax=Pseudoruegeria sp. SHC-113 TaxID=2855439 RepID=UPI0021BB8063|nr:sn-glycerol-3-phosphate ABC transporter ATP-binding protein UgpC [Pseudoruegeria sp. SHC-113]MCT8160638.1 sn-glycerol-3-phosphate ABC transporter ATP-binding protein UgpC [Pseudoruegeria sp. SHC-113]